MVPFHWTICFEPKMSISSLVLLSFFISGQAHILGTLLLVEKHSGFRSTAAPGSILGIPKFFLI